MEIKKYKKLKDNRYKIIFTTEEEIVLYDDIILKYNLLLTKKIEKAKLEEIIKENEALACYYKALKYLAVKNRSKKEIQNYLNRFDYAKNDIERTISKLEKQNLINEDNYIKAYINDQILFSMHGPDKIKNKLLELGLPKEKILVSLEKISPEIWQEKLQKIVSKRVTINRKDSQRKLKEKILYYCLNEGYKKEDINDALNKIDFPQDNDILEKEADKLYKKLMRKYSDNDLLYQLKMKLIVKGFTYEEVEKIITKYKINP